MKTKTKALLITMCAALLVVATVFTTLAFLTDDKSVVNSFTVGNVHIKLDEAKVDTAGVAIGTERTESGNDFHLLPGHEYTKDPTVTVLGTSEDCYVRMFVTITQSQEWDNVCDAHNREFGAANMFLYKNGDTYTEGFNPAWDLHNVTENTDPANTRTYEFWYKGGESADYIVEKNADITPLPALFDQIKMPTQLTNDDLDAIDGTDHKFKIYAVAQAIQADGFTTAEAAFNAAPAITGSKLTPTSGSTD